MYRGLKGVAAGVAAIAMVTTATAAAAQDSCVSEREISSMMIYAVPEVIGAAQTKCSTRLSKTGFMATKSDAMKADYAALQDEMWPNAKRALLKFGASRDKDKSMTQMIEGLPDEAMRPFVDAIVLQMIAKEVKPEHCRNIERGFSLVSKLSPRDTGALIGFIVGVSGVKNPKVCPYDSK